MNNLQGTSSNINSGFTKFTKIGGKIIPIE